MDEPTTHLDMASIDALIAALRQFTGTLIFISHDVYFIRQISNHVVRVDAGRLTHFPGGYQYYLDKTAAASAASRAPRRAGKPRRRRRPARPTARSKSDWKPNNARPVPASARRSRSAWRNWRRKFCNLETRQKELTAALEDPEVYQQPGQAMRTSTASGLKTPPALEHLAREWEQAAEQALAAE